MTFRLLIRHLNINDTTKEKENTPKFQVYVGTSLTTKKTVQHLLIQELGCNWADRQGHDNAEHVASKLEDMGDSYWQVGVDNPLEITRSGYDWACDRVEVREFNAVERLSEFVAFIEGWTTKKGETPKHEDTASRGLPVLEGHYSGELCGDGSIVEYGCVRVNIQDIENIYSVISKYNNRKSEPVGCVDALIIAGDEDDVTVTVEDLSRIRNIMRRAQAQK